MSRSSHLRTLSEVDQTDLLNHMEKETGISARLAIREHGFVFKMACRALKEEGY